MLPDVEKKPTKQAGGKTTSAAATGTAVTKREDPPEYIGIPNQRRRGIASSLTKNLAGKGNKNKDTKPSSKKKKDDRHRKAPQKTMDQVDVESKRGRRKPRDP